jgi:hypothetical protein
VNVTGNQASRVYNTITPQQARYVKLNVTKPTSTTDTATRIYELEVYSAGSTANTFATGFESNDAQPTWSNTADSGVYPAGGISNITGVCCGLTGPETATRSGETAHTGSAALMYSGSAQGASADYAYMKLFDVSGQSLNVGNSTILNYWIYPQSSATSNLVSGSNSTCVALDLIFSDGTNLRDSGAVDQNGNRIHPAAQCGHLTLDTWNHVSVNLGAIANGKAITRIDLGYDQPNSTGGYRGYIDDITIQ